MSLWIIFIHSNRCGKVNLWLVLAMANEFRYVVNGFLCTSCAMIGLMLNSIAIFILVSKKDFRRPFHQLLVALLCFDNGVLVSWIFSWFFLSGDDNNIGAYHTRFKALGWIYAYFLYPMLIVSIHGSVFVTLALSLERYVSIKKCIENPQSVMILQPQLSHLLKYLLPISTFVIIFNIPSFLCYEVVEHEGKLWVVPTKFCRELYFTKVYMHWTRLIVIGIIPICMLIFFNFRVYQMTKDNFDKKRQDQNSVKPACELVRSTKDENSKEKQLVTVLAGIVIAFLVCHR